MPYCRTPCLRVQGVSHPSDVRSHLLFNQNASLTTDPTLDDAVLFATPPHIVSCVIPKVGASTTSAADSRLYAVALLDKVNKREYIMNDAHVDASRHRSFITFSRSLVPKHIE